MALLNIVKEGEDILRKKCFPVKEITPRIITLLDDMKETLLESGGVGLAAPQVGVARRIVLVMDVNKDDIIYELINPEIIATEGEQEELEGCLSVPDTWAITRRPMKATVRAMNRDGEYFEVSGEGMTAKCFCHELDHLEGKLFIDDALHILTPEEVEEIMGD